MSGRTRVAVVGGGIAGLAAAHELAADPAYDVVVLESSDRVGGKLRLAEVAGVTVDVGAEAMLNRRPEAVDLARSVGLDLVHPAATTSSLWTRGQLRPLPRSMMGVPADLDQLAASGVLTEEGLERVSREPSLAPTTLDGDVSVAELIGSRLGPEVVDRLVEPLLGGVYAGHASELSARAAVPQVVAMLERGSLLEAAREMPTSDVPVFASIPGGVGRLPARLAEGLDVRTGVTVREVVAVESPGGPGFELVTGSAARPERMLVDRVVVATPAAPASRLLADVAPVASSVLGEVEYASMAIVTLAVRAADLVPTRAATGISGFLVPPVDGRAIKAATFSFAKWEWVAEAGGSLAILRASLGRHREEAALQVTDEELVATALADLREAIGPFADPVDWHVQRWGGGLPQYAVGHLDRVRRVRDAVAEVPGLAVCGAAYDGIGIPATIASARAAVARIRQGG
jgi:oxygen-dependent protoporphyrinogen oxidase